MPNGGSVAGGVRKVLRDERENRQERAGEPGVPARGPGRRDGGGDRGCHAGGDLPGAEARGERLLARFRLLLCARGARRVGIQVQPVPTSAPPALVAVPGSRGGVTVRRRGRCWE